MILNPLRNQIRAQSWTLGNTIDLSYQFFTLKKISLHLLNLGSPPVSQEGEERKIYWKIKSHEGKNPN